MLITLMKNHNEIRKVPRNVQMAILNGLKLCLTLDTVKILWRFFFLFRNYGWSLQF